MSPAISDAGLARLLAAADTAPPMPAGLMDAIMAALPVAVPIAVPALPPVTARRRPRQRWVRAGVTMVAGLGLATAVAATLARTPLFAPLLAPAMTRLAEVTGVPALAPRARPVLPAAPLPDKPGLPTQPQVRIMSEPPAPPQLTPVPLPDLTAGAPPAARPVLTSRPVLAARPVLAERPMLAERRAIIERPALPRAENVRALSERFPAERPLADRPAVREALRVALPAALPDQPALAQRLQARAADLPPVEPAAPIGEPGAEAGRVNAGTVPSTEKAAAVASKIAALREARQAGGLSADRRERLRALQQVRAARAARAAREAAPRLRR